MQMTELPNPKLPNPDPTNLASGPLAGIRVLDLTSVVMGPYATQMLGDLGADVVKIEEPAGDLSRSMGPGRQRGMSGTALNLHRNKRSVLLDLKNAANRPIVEALVRRSDVIVTNLRPGPLARLNLGYEACRDIRHDTIFCQAHGWPSDSEHGDRPAYDDIIQSATGAADLMERVTTQVKLFPSIVADKVCGLMILNGVLAALYHRERSGEGQRIEVPMIDAALSFQLVEHLAGAAMEPPMSAAGYGRVVSPERGSQCASDGWITVLPYDDRQWRAMFVAGGRPDLADDARFSNAYARSINPDALYTELGKLLATRTVAEWMDACAVMGVAAEPVRSLDDAIEIAMANGSIMLAEHPIVGTYRQVQPPIRMSATPQNVWRHAPLIGEHTDEVLAELGLADGSV